MKRTIKIEPSEKDQNSAPREFYVFNNKLYFNANDGVHGEELWVYDGINEPQIFKDINPNDNYSDGLSRLFTVFKDQLYFKHDDDVWFYDGINEPRKDSKIHDDLEFWIQTRDLTVFNDRLLITSSDRILVYDGINPPQEIPINISDNEELEMTGGGIVFNEKFYFTIATETYGEELWFYDGINPAQIVQDIAPNPSGISYYHGSSFKVTLHKVSFSS